jgi:hypothetical protein
MPSWLRSVPPSSIPPQCFPPAICEFPTAWAESANLPLPQ